MAMWTLGIKRIFAPEDWETLKMLIPYYLEFKYRFAFCISCVILIQLIGLAIPPILGAIVTDLSDKPGIVLVVPVTLLLSYVLVRFGAVIIPEIQNAVFGTITVRASRRLSLKLLKHLHNLDLEYHLARKTGGLTRDMDRGIASITSLMTLFAFQFLGMFISIGGVIWILGGWFNWLYAVIIAAAAIFYIVYTVKVTDWRTPFIRESNEAHSIAHTRAVDSLINHETVKYFGNEQFEYDHYDRELAHWERARAKNRYSLAALNIGQSFIVQIGLFWMLIIAATSVVNAEFGVGDFVTINGYATMVFGPLGMLGGIYRRLKQAFTDVERMLEILANQPTVVSTSNATALPSGDGPIVFENVNFAYRPDRPILKNVSFRIEDGEKVALVGPSGGGKSTIARLLFRFYDIDSGHLQINGVNIQDVDLDNLRSRIGVVPQDTTLFNATLHENLMYGRTDASDSDLQRAIEMSQLRGLISQLPLGLETVVGERGLKLSGGEKQRVAIARALLKNPSFLIFDEATSSLDTQTEATILQAIDHVATHHTTLVIAHRLSTITDADRIVVIVQGEVKESGTHEQLLAKDQIYAQLWLRQSKATRIQKAHAVLNGDEAFTPDQQKAS